MAHRDLNIVALHLHDHWSASFSGSPERGFGGATAREAAQRLLKADGRIDFDCERALEIGSSEGDSKLELVIRVS